MVDNTLFVAMVAIWVVFGVLLLALVFVLRAYLGYKYPKLAAPYHVVRGAWYTARYPGGARAAADMLRDERALHMQSNIAARLCEAGCETCGEFVRVAALRDRMRR